MLKQMMSQNSHWQINKDFARAFGLEATILMTDLIDKWLYHGRPEWFWSTADQLEEATTLSRHKQNKAFAILEGEGFLERKVMGLPAKQHYKIVETKIVNFFNHSLEKISKLDCKEFQNTNNNTVIKIQYENTGDINREIDKNESSLKTDETAVDIETSAKQPIPSEILEAFGQDLIPKTKTQAKAWEDVYDKLQRIDGLTDREIIAIVRKIRSDPFWVKNFLALPKLRRKNPDGVPYWRVFQAQIQTVSNKPKTLYDGKTKNEIEDKFRRAASWEL